MYDILLKSISFWNNIRNYVTVFALVGMTVCYIGWDNTSKELETQVALRAADRANYEAEQSEYEARALEEKMEIERINNERVQEAEANYESVLAGYRNSLRVYQSRESARSTSSRSDLPGPAPITEGSDGPTPDPGVPTEYLTISYADADICAINTARVVATYNWSLTQITE